MALSKDLKAKIRNLKSGDDLAKQVEELFSETEDYVTFPSDGAFLTAAEQKNKAKVAAAEAEAAKAKESAKDLETKLAKALEDAGVDDVEKIAEVKAKLAAANGSLTEFDKLKADHAKLIKDREKDGKTIAELSGFKTTHLKRAALAPHLSKIHPDLRDDLEGAWLSQLTIDDKGEKVTFPEGKEIGAFIDEKIKTKPSLKAPDYKAGAGTEGGTGKAGDNGKPKGDPAKPDPNAPKPTFREAMVQAMTEGAAAQGLTGP